MSNCVTCFVFFFFKQKTAYEMRISDWSSDVCSSDLAKVRKELRRWLRQLHEQMGLTSIFVTHDQEEALELADRVVVMDHGVIEQIGTPEEVYMQIGSASCRERVCQYV